MRILSFPICLLSLCMLTACEFNGYSDAKPKADLNEPRLLDIPALPLIQNAVIVMAPVIEPQRNEWVMRQICALARGDSNQAEVNETMAREGVDVNKIPVSGSPLSLLVNGDTAKRNTLCAAYLVKSVLLPPDVSDFVSSTVSMEKKSAPAKSSRQIDPKRMSQVLAVKLAVAKASADVFALIALELQRTPGLTVGQFGKRTQQLFSSLAPNYLKRVRELYESENVEYVLTSFSDERFAFNSNDGSSFEYSRSGMTLKVNNIVWYGEGQLLGKTYLWRVDYFDPSMVKLLDAEESEYAKK